MDDTGIGIGLMVCGFALWFVMRKAYIGRWPWVILLAVSLHGSVYAVAPEGYNEKYRVSWSGMGAHAATNLQDTPLGPILKAGTMECVWNGNGWSVTKNGLRFELKMNFGGAPDEQFLATVDADGFTVGSHYYFGAVFKAAAIAGPYTVVDANHIVYPSFWYSEETQTEHVIWDDLDDFGFLQVIGADPKGTELSAGSVPYSVVFSSQDKLWRTEDGAMLAPLHLMTAKQFWPRMQATGSNFTNISNVTMPQATEAFGWNNLLSTASGPLTVNNNPGEYTYWGTYPALTPARWTMQAAYAPSFGGYAVAALDVCRVEVHEQTLTVNFKGRPEANQPHEDKTVTAAAFGLRVKGTPTGANVERWLIVFSTERDTRKPYIEIRKPSGQRVRVYAAGHSIRGQAVFRYESDGVTEHEQLRGTPVGGYTTNFPTAFEQTILTGFYLVLPAINQFTGSPEYPAEGLPADAVEPFDFGDHPLDRIKSILEGGEGSDSDVSFNERVKTAVATTQATTKPPFLGFKLDEEGVAGGIPESPEAWCALLDTVAIDFGMSGGISGVAITNGQQSLGAIGEFLVRITAAVPWLINNAGSVLVIVRFATSLLLLYFVGLYAWNRFWWSVTGEKNDAPFDIAGAAAQTKED